MHFKSVFTVTFDAETLATARHVAKLHHAQLRDQLQVEGADHPHDISLDHLFCDGQDMLIDAVEKAI